MTGQRCRLVITQNGTEHVSSLILAADEVPDHLEVEARMHELDGWRVDRFVNGVGRIISVRCKMGTTVRSIQARLFDPMEDAGT